MHTNKLLPGMWVRYVDQWFRLDERTKDTTYPHLWHLKFYCGKRIAATANFDWQTKEMHFIQTPNWKVY